MDPNRQVEGLQPQEMALDLGMSGRAVQEDTWALSSVTTSSLPDEPAGTALLKNTLPG